MKTSELTGAALDWAVATANEDYPQWDSEWKVFFAANGEHINYSTDWAQGGPIIEREGIGVYKLDGGWSAHCAVVGSIQACMDGQPTPLIAAMRCYVASKLGDAIEIPEELTNVRREK